MNIVSYVTALAWILGIFGAIALIAILWEAFSEEKEDHELGCVVWIAFLAWAWLIARYLHI